MVSTGSVRKKLTGLHRTPIPTQSENSGMNRNPVWEPDLVTGYRHRTTLMAEREQQPQYLVEEMKC